MAICFGGNWKYEMAGFGNIHWRVTGKEIPNDDKDVIKIYLNNLIVNKIYKFAYKEKPNYMPDVEMYITYEQIRQLIKINLTL